MKTKQILTAGAIALSMILTGCSASSTETKDTKTTEVTKKKEVKTIGQKNKDSKSLKFTNITGKKITVFETKSSSEENFSDNLLGNGDVVKNKEERTLNSKPAEHTHNWVAVTETRTVVDQPAYDEQVPVTEMKEHEICNQCGADLTGLDIDAHFKNSYFNGGNCGGFHSEWREEVTGYQTVHHDAVTHTETVTTGYRCSTCGATK